MCEFIIEGMGYMLARTVVLACAISPVFAAVDVMDEIVCKVNGEIITRSELERDRKALEAELKRQGLTGARLEEAMQKKFPDILRDRIDTLLLVQKGKELDVKVDADLNKQFAEFQRRSNIADPEKFQEFVREQTGMPYEDFRSEQRNNLLTQRVIGEEVARKIQFKKEELEAYYNDHKADFVRKEAVYLRQIFVAAKDAAGVPAAEKKAKDLAARAKKGERFGELALTNSDDQATAQNGGLLDPYEKGALAPELEAMIWDKERGYVTDPIKIQQGFLILRVEDHQKAGQASFEDVQNEIQNRLTDTRMQPALRAYLTKLRTQAFLEIKPGYEDSGAAPGKDTTWMDPAQLKPEQVTKEQVAAQSRKKRLLKVVPIPGTTASKNGTSSSR